MTWFDWCLGALVAERFSAGRRAFGRPVLWIAGLAPAFVLSSMFKPLTMFSFTLAAAIGAVALDAALASRRSVSTTGRTLALLGTISYSLYLWHQPLLNPVVQMLTPVVGSGLAWAVLAATLLAVAALSYLLIEQPGIRLGRRLAASRAASAEEHPTMAIDPELRGEVRNAA